MHLKHISDQQQMISLIGFDQVVSSADHFGLTIQLPAQKASLGALIAYMVKQYQGTTGIVLSPELGFDAIESADPSAGLLFPLERRLYDADPLSVPILTPQWGVEAIKNNYGIAKIELLYHPEEKEAATKRQMLAELYDYCRHEGIALLLELVIFYEGSEQQYAREFPELQLRAVQELRASCSLMALEYPLSTLAAVTVTAELDIPWILTSRSTQYDVFKEQLRTALESGAKGFLAMEQFLPPLSTSGSQQFNQAAAEAFISGTGRDRVLELTRITREAGIPLQ